MSYPYHSDHIFTYFYDNQWYYSDPDTHCLMRGDPPFQTKEQAEAGAANART